MAASGIVIRGDWDGDLPKQVAKALAAGSPGRAGAAVTNGDRWHYLAWGDPADRPLLLLHGIGSSAEGWWRVGPALAASGHYVVAPNMPGHGGAAAEAGAHRLAATATLVAHFAERVGLSVPSLTVVGHSWGALVACHLPQLGVAPARLVLVDPPWLSLAELEELSRDPSEQGYDSVETALAALEADSSDWAAMDVAAKARALVQLDPAFVRAALLENGPYDAGIGALRGSRASNSAIWLIRGDPAAGGLVPDNVLAEFAAVAAEDHMITLAGAPHSPHRTHPQATVFALLVALDAVAYAGTPRS